MTTKDKQEEILENNADPKAEDKKVELNIEEDINSIFSGEDLTEEFKKNAKAIFEAAILAKVSEEKSKLDEEYATKLAEETAKINENLVNKVDEYLEYVVTEWMEENKLAIENGIRAEIAEDFMVGLKNLFAEHYIDVPQDKVDMVEELSSKVETLEQELDKMVTENSNLNSEISGYKKEQIVAEVSESLSEIQIAKLKSLAENIEFVSEEDYKEKVSLTKKKYFEEQSDEESDRKLEEGDIQTNNNLSPLMERYVANISKFSKK